MSSLNEIISEAKYEVKGNARITFTSGEEGTVEFTISMMNNGVTTGNLIFVPVDMKFTILLSKNEDFVLDGTTSDGHNLFAPECHIIKSNQKYGKEPSLKVTFHAYKVILDKENLSKKSSKQLLINCSVVNVSQTLPITVNSDFGELTLINYKGIEELDKIRRSHRISLITSGLHLLPKIDTSSTLENIKTSSLEFIRNFLKISSLAQTVYHDIAMFTIYEKNDSTDGYSLLYLELFDPKTKSPYSIGLANTVSYSHFIKSAWSGYSEDVDKKFGFTLALEWYLDSWSSSILESRFLSASTCLEMLMDKFHSNSKSEFILPKEIFYEFQKQIKDFVKKNSESFGFNAPTRGLIYENLGEGLNRRSFVNKAELLLAFWGIKYDDLGISLNDIVRIRNDITHRCQHADDEQS